MLKRLVEKILLKSFPGVVMSKKVDKGSPLLPAPGNDLAEFFYTSLIEKIEACIFTKRTISKSLVVSPGSLAEKVDSLPGTATAGRSKNLFGISLDELILGHWPKFYPPRLSG